MLIWIDKVGPESQLLERVGDFVEEKSAQDQRHTTLKVEREFRCSLQETSVQFGILFEIGQEVAIRVDHLEALHHFLLLEEQEQIVGGDGPPGVPTASAGQWECWKATALNNMVDLPQLLDNVFG